MTREEERSAFLKWLEEMSAQTKAQNDDLLRVQRLAHQSQQWMEGMADSQEQIIILLKDIRELLQQVMVGFLLPSHDDEDCNTT